MQVMHNKTVKAFFNSIFNNTKNITMVMGIKAFMVIVLVNLSTRTLYNKFIHPPLLERFLNIYIYISFY